MSPRNPALLRDGGGDQKPREHLIATAARLIAEHGSVDLTVRGIAREAKVADDVLYNHFAAKEELLAEALHAHVTTVMTGAGEPPVAGRSTVEDNLRDYITSGLEVLTRILPAFAGLISQHKIFARSHPCMLPAWEQGATVCEPPCPTTSRTSSNWADWLRKPDRRRGHHDPSRPSEPFPLRLLQLPRGRLRGEEPVRPVRESLTTAPTAPAGCAMLGGRTAQRVSPGLPARSVAFPSTRCTDQ
ncbi:TetR/AcrR family transcriptional regulator [Streptomyces sp. PAN_FS17]|uniref:TetR/AcrR family transcriptional regulator n=1 Tax=Streptomyces sp. PAN_FS17 TaxID=1855351 RepID=UPI00115FB4B3|nr:helix-turn-helix domain-containing protein [Streptomyces sp. PAN_FS17]